MPRKEKTKIDIDVLPYLSIMLCVLGIICLIIVVMVMNIALNPKAAKVLAFHMLYQGFAKGESATPGAGGNVVKSPSYLDCSAEGVNIFPGDITVLAGELQQTSNQVKVVIDRIQGNASNEYVIVLVRPGSLPVYRQVRKMLANRPIDIAYDALEANAKIDWKKEAKDLNIRLE